MNIHHRHLITLTPCNLLAQSYTQNLASQTLQDVPNVVSIATVQEILHHVGRPSLKCIRNHIVLFVNIVKITLMNDEILV